MRQLTVCPFFAGIPIIVHTGAKFTTDIKLLPDYTGLIGGEEARACLASHRMGEAVIRTVTSLGVLSTGATRLAAFDRAFRERAAAHGIGIG
jgi:hypothetical protein